MVACGTCQLQNSLDSSFCRRCGKELDADLLQQARSELGRTVAQGFVLFNEGKIDDATRLSELALTEDPTLTTAISLKGMCHERRGELSEALACYERVLEFTPDSALDRIKVDQIRASIASKASIVEEQRAQPDKKMALAVALMAILFFGGVGALAYKLLDASQTRTPLASNSPTASDLPVGVGFPDTAGTSKTPLAPATTGQAGAVTNARPVDSGGDNSDGNTTAIPPPAPVHNNTDDAPGPGLSSIRPVSPSGGALPPASEVIGTSPIEGPVGQPAPTNRTDPDPGVASDSKPTTRTASVDPAPQAQDDPGQIEINVTNRTPKNSGGSQSVDEGPSAQNLSKVASQEFQLKRYDSAAQKYEKLLKAGGDPASINQRLAQCYENLGKKSEAVGAYQRAVKAIKENIQSGKGNPTRQKAALESCEAAIKVLNEGA